MEHFKDKVITGLNRCEDSSMQASGIPYQTMIINQFEDFKVELLTRMNYLQGTWESNALEIKNSIIGMETSLPDSLKTMLRTDFTFDSRPLYQDDFHRHMNDAEQRILQSMSKIIDEKLISSRVQSASVIIDHHAESRSLFTRNGFKLFSWGGKHDRLVPENWLIDSFDVLTLWNQWFHGVPSAGICPFHEVAKQRGAVTNDISKSRFCRAKMVINCILSKAVAAGCTREGENVTQADDRRLATIFNAGFEGLITGIYGRMKRNASQLNYNTIGEQLKKKRKRS